MGLLKGFSPALLAILAALHVAEASLFLVERDGGMAAPFEMFELTPNEGKDSGEVLLFENPMFSLPRASLLDSLLGFPLFDFLDFSELLGNRAELFGPPVDFKIDREAGVCLIDVDITSIPKNSGVSLSVDEAGLVEMTYENDRSKKSRGFLGRDSEGALPALASGSKSNENSVVLPEENEDEDDEEDTGFIASVYSSRHFYIPNECDPANTGAKATMLNNQKLLRIRLALRDGTEVAEEETKVKPEEPMKLDSGNDLSPSIDAMGGLADETVVNEQGAEVKKEEEKAINELQKSEDTEVEQAKVPPPSGKESDDNVYTGQASISNTASKKKRKIPIVSYDEF